VKNIEQDITHTINQNFYYYEGVEGNNEEPKNRSSGAYIFRPVNQQRIDISASAPELEAYTGIQFLKKIQRKV